MRQKYREPLLVLGILLVIAGVLMTLNDAQDIGSFTHAGDREWKGINWSFMPDWVHHWWIGLLLILTGFYIIYRIHS
jgi:uncharacterized membrane protein HdeD (DUF308 family)